MKRELLHVAHVDEYLVVAAIIAVVAGVACSHRVNPAPVPPPEPVRGLEVLPRLLHVSAGSHVPLHAFIEGAATPATGTSWSSSDGEVVTVDANGMLTASAKGKAKACAAAPGFMVSCAEVTVCANVINGYDPNTGAAMPKPLTLSPGQQVQLKLEQDCP